MGFRPGAQSAQYTISFLTYDLSVELQNGLMYLTCAKNTALFILGAANHRLSPLNPQIIYFNTNKTIP